MRKILVGIDGSKGSENALNKAITLIDEYGELYLLAVVPSKSEEIFIDTTTLKEIKKKAHRLIDDIISDLGDQNFSVKGIIEEGDPSSNIIDISGNLNVDLIVLGSKGSSKIGAYLIGSVASRVVQYAHKPVMVVR